MAEEADSHLFTSVDPAPAALPAPVEELEEQLMDVSLSLFNRMRAIFALRAAASPEAVRALGRALLEDGSALLRHECAFVLGQMRAPLAVPFLERALTTDPSPMVRHEAAESLGNIATQDCIPLLLRALEEDPAEEVKESCEIALDNIRYIRGDVP
jgi:deoxyhypusine monooxygenase